MRVRWRSFLPDGAIAVGLACLAEVQLALYDPCCGSNELTPAGATLTLIETLALAARRRVPAGALLVMGAAAITQVAIRSRVTDFAQLGVVIAFYTVAAQSRQWLAIGAAALTPAGILAAGTHVPPTQPSFLLLLYAEFATAWGLGQMVRHRRRREAVRAAGQEQERERQSREAALAERERIARELHDVVAHSLSVIAIQAGAAQAVMNVAPEKLTVCLATIESVSREAWVEMRRFLDDEPSRSGLAQVEELVERFESAGLAVDLVVGGEPRPLSPEADHCAYRVVQEALTNALRHASGGRARVSICYEECGVRVEVASAGEAALTSSGGFGRRGLVGMRQRLLLAGGELAVTAGQDHFVVTARLPLVAEDVCT